ncbi:MAG: V0D/AC39 family V-type ATPase subunit [Planctomycetota bacterium]
MNTSPSQQAPASGLRGIPLDFLAAKIRGRRSWLYERDRLRELTREADLTDLALRLFPRQDIPDRPALERRLLDSCVADLAALSLYVDGAVLAFYRSLLDRYVVENLKVLLRLLAGGAGPPEAAGYLIELPHSLRFDAEELLSSADVEEFVTRIPLRQPRDCALEALPLYADSGRRAYLEMALDRGYWAAVWEAAGQLPLGAGPRSCAPIRAEFDAMRLLATLRAAAYEIPWEQWERLLPLGPGGIGTEALRRIHAAPDVAALADALPGWAPGREAADSGDLEEVFWHGAVHLADRQFYGTGSAVALLVSYFYLKREELRHLLGLTQMLRYGSEQAAIQQQLDL